VVDFLALPTLVVEVVFDREIDPVIERPHVRLYVMPEGRPTAWVCWFPILGTCIPANRPLRMEIEVGDGHAALRELSAGTEFRILQGDEDVGIGRVISRATPAMTRH